MDPRFGLDEAQFAATVREAAALWDREMDGPAFVKARRAELLIELEFDERQERWHARQEAAESLNAMRDRYDQLVAELDGQRADLRDVRQRYEQFAAAYRIRRDHYEAHSRFWQRQEDQRPGAPRTRAAAVLQQLLAELERLADAEEQARERFNGSLAVVRSAADELHDKISRVNEQFSQHREFDKALFTFVHRGGVTRRSITVFQFDDKADLRQVLAHELGHALGINHVADPAALMFYLVSSENRGLTRLTEADREALVSACGITNASRSAPAFESEPRASGAAR